MTVSLKDRLVSTCQYYVETVCVHRSKIGIETGAEYYLRTSNDKLIKAKESLSRSTHNLKYVVVVPFIKKYSTLFELGEQLEWKKFAKSVFSWILLLLHGRDAFSLSTVLQILWLFLMHILHKRIVNWKMFQKSFNTLQYHFVLLSTNKYSSIWLPLCSRLSTLLVLGCCPSNPPDYESGKILHIDKKNKLQLSLHSHFLMNWKAFV